MSKLRDLIEARMYEPPASYVMKQQLPALCKIEASVLAGADSVFCTKYRYRVTVTLGSEKVVARPSEIEDVKGVILKGITNFVFGEFRGDIIDLETALWEDNVDAAKSALSALKKKMFDD